MEKVGMQLKERFRGQDEEGTWTGVRYEVTRDPSPRRTG
jgi:hypothetical protein